jgi:hypothetical protein
MGIWGLMCLQLRLMLPLTICRWAKAALAIGFVAYLHGTSLVFLLALSLANFLLSRFAAGFSIACVSPALPPVALLAVTDTLPTLACVSMGSVVFVCSRPPNHTMLGAGALLYAFEHRGLCGNYGRHTAFRKCNLDSGVS